MKTKLKSKKKTKSREGNVRVSGGIVEKAREKRQEMVAIALLGIALFLLIAIISFREGFERAREAGEGPVNVCGFLGYFLADKFLWLFGSSSIFLFIFLGLWGGVLFVRRGVIGIGPKIFGILVFTLCMSVLFQLHAPYGGDTPIAAVQSGRRPYGLGGMSGLLLEPWVSSGFGPVGTYIFVGIMLAISFLLATEWCFFPLISALSKRWKERREHRAELELLKQDEQEGKEEAEKELVAKKEEEKEDSLEKKPTKESFVSNLLRKNKQSEKPAEEESKVNSPAPARKEKRLPLVRPPKAGDWKLPPLDLLDESEKVAASALEKEIKANAAVLEGSLKSFGIEAAVVAAEKGPVVTMYELELAAGTKVSKIISLSDDLAIALKAQSVRVVAPIPGKSTVGIEVPNSLRERVRMKELIGSNAYKKDLDAIPLFLGKDVGGKPLIDDLAQMPHLLIAGATGSGKSVMVNSIICSILCTRSPEEVKLILIDPKMVELQPFQKVPHLLCPVVTNPRKAATILEWACAKMDGRYELLSQVGVKNIASYNQLGEKEVKKRLDAAFVEGETPVHLPYIVLIIDELADLMLLAAKEVETSITRLAQKSRAVGIHVILATQRPSTDVITGLIKANLPTRVAFQVASKIDSRVILDNNGAEKLLGAGDMLYTPPRSSTIVRSQATFVSEPEIRRIVSYLGELGQPAFSQELIQTSGGATSDDDNDELYEQAVRIVLEQQRGSASLLQRALGIGYTRASRLIDIMRREGIVGDFKGSKSSEVMMTLKDWESRQQASSNSDSHNEEAVQPPS